MKRFVGAYEPFRFFYAAVNVLEVADQKRTLIGIPRINSTMLREHSTFFGFASALVCAIVAGSVSHWSPIWMATTAIAGIFFFPRCFYGFKEARALRGADFELGSGKSVSWYVEPPPNQLKAKAHAEMRRGDTC